MQSDNVSAETLADHVGRALGGGPDGSPVDAFVAQMNALARSKGMLKTKFLNPHGLDNLERSVPTSTAEDLARLTAYAMGNEAFHFRVSSANARSPSSEPVVDRRATCCAIPTSCSGLTPSMASRPERPRAPDNA